MDRSILWSYVLSEAGARKLGDQDELGRALAGGDEAVWVHLDAKSDGVRAWLEGAARLDRLAVDALLAPETRPRCTMLDAGILLHLRGINFNEGDEPEDMVSIRIWTDGRRLISVRLRTLRAAAAIKAELDAGLGPRGAGELLLNIARNLVHYMGPVITDYDEQLDRLEDGLSARHSAAARTKLREFRQKVVTLRRFIAPQRDALNQLAALPLGWRSEYQRQGIVEAANEVTRLIEALSATWERTAILQDELATLLSEQANRRLYLLTIIAAIFLPLGLLTGLLGINVGGIPGTDNAAAFLIVSGILVVIGLAELILFRLLRWF